MPISVTLPPTVIAWLDRKVQSRVYASRSHAVELLVLEASMREDSSSGGSGASTPDGFRVEREFSVSGPDAAGLEDLKGRFTKAMAEAVGMGITSHVVKVDGKLFYRLRKLGSNVAEGKTIEEYVAISQDLRPVRLKVTTSIGPTGMPGRVDAEENPVGEKEFEALGLRRQEIFGLIDRFIKGVDLF
jgi:Arc/MetJ-type ribon-helix-helix transcriptional regulator